MTARQILMLGATITAVAIGATAVHSQPTAYDPAIETRTTIADGFTFVAVGDIIYPLPMAGSPDKAFQDAMNRIREGDVAFGNLEMTMVDIDDFKGPVSNGGFWGTPELAEDLKALGFDALGRANNHLYDYGQEGMLETNAHLDRVGIAHSGSGKGPGAARAPGYLMTNKGRVAFVAISTSHSPTFTSLPTIVRAAPAVGVAPPRPGVSQLATTQIFNVPASLVPSLRAVKDAFPTGGALYAPTNDTDTRFSVMGQTFQVANVDRPQFTYEISTQDEAEILRSVREGKMKSDFLAFGIHSHETRYADKPDTDPYPGDFLQPFARKVIDTGADSFVGTGVHVLRGIEIYKGRPIFYGLGELFRQMDINRAPGQDPVRGDINSDPAKYETVIAVSRYERGTLAEVRLYPIEMGVDLRMAHRGIPRTASPAGAKRILERLQTLSEPYGTRIAIEDNVGVIRVTGSRR